MFATLEIVEYRKIEAIKAMGVFRVHSISVSSDLQYDQSISTDSGIPQAMLHGG